MQQRMHRFGFRSAVAVIAGAVSVSGSVSADPAETAQPDRQSAWPIYTAMVSAMKRESPPASLTYDETFTPDGLRLRIPSDRRSSGRPELVFSSDRSATTLSIVQRDPSGPADVVDRTTGQSFSGQSMFWAATWSTVHAMKGVTPSIATTPAAVPSADAPPNGVMERTPLRVVADVMVVTDRFYDVRYADEANVDGVPTDHLHLTPRTNPDDHPLTDLFVSQDSHLLQAVTTKFKNEATISGFSGSMTLHFGRVGAYWIVSGGTVTASAHVFFSHSSGSLAFAVSNVSYGTPTP